MPDPAPSQFSGLPRPSDDGSASKAPPLSPRRRRLRRTVVILLTLVLAGTALGTWLWWRHRPRPYQPGEASADVTSDLQRHLPPEAPAPRWTDVTRHAGLDAFRNFTGARTSQLPEDMGPGLAWGDFDNDGDDDLFLVSAGGALPLPQDQLSPCALYENLGDGTFRLVKDFPELRLRGLGAAWGDYDGDGFLDLAVSGYNSLLLLHNEAGPSGRRFARDARFPDRPGFWSGLAWADFDHDRDLDLYVCQYVLYRENEADLARGSDQLGTFVPYTLNPASYPPGKNLLLRNNGDGTFTDAAEALGVDNPTGRSLGALWHDFDDDGWLDLYVANDISDNAFFHNTGGKFEDVSHGAWVADYRSAMGLAAGDYNRDGDDDLFITHWVAQENALYDNVWADFNSNQPKPAAPAGPAGAGLKGAANGSTNANPAAYPLRFVDVNQMKGLGQVALPRVGWGTEFVDFDGDGWLDLIVANGSTIERSGPPPKRLEPQRPFLFWNRRGEFFYDLAPLVPALSQPHVSRGLAVADFDLDGDMDIAVAQLGEGVQLLRNEMQSGNWLEVRLHSKNASGQTTGFGDGCKVIVRAGGASLRRTVSSVSYLSQSSHLLHFGLGSAVQVETVEVRWQAGATNVFQSLPANSKLELTEDDPVPKVRTENRFPLPKSVPATTGPAASPLDEKAKLIEFWRRQRAAMDAVKIEHDPLRAIPLFEAALALNPTHEDSHYYLAQCLAVQGDAAGALDHLRTLQRINPQSHRAFQQWGVLKAQSARTPEDLASADASLERAHAINPEETGALLAWGEVALMRGNFPKAEERLGAVCQTNPKAVGGFFLRGYIAWKQGDAGRAQSLLDQARRARGKSWQPAGATSEGDVKAKLHLETRPLARFEEAWDGSTNLPAAFAALDRELGAWR
jgi:enediyne biosynthesis protein E4